MKYTIEGFSQKFAMSLKKEFNVGGKTVLRKIDCTDLVILRWFVDFYPNMKKIEVDGKQYAWLTHKKLLEDLPIIDISKKAFIERMQKLVDFNILTYKLIKEGGTFSLYGFGENYENLISDRVVVQTDTKDKSITDTSIKDYSLYDILKEYNFSFEIEEKINEWLTYKKEKKQSYKPTGFKTLLKNIQNAIYEIGEQAVLDSIDNCIASNYSGLFFNKKNKSNNAIVSKSKKQNDQFLDWCAEAYEILEGQ